MADRRIKKLAKILTDYSVNIKKGDLVEISADNPAAEPLIKEAYKNVLKKGGLPYLRIGLSSLRYTYYKNASLQQLKHCPEIAEFEAKKTDAFIRIGCQNNTRELTSINPKKISLRAKTTKKIADIITDKDNWIYCQYPTQALAQDADMSLEEFEDFVYGACLVDWKKVSRKLTKIKDTLEKGNKVRIVGKDTELEFSIKDKKAVKCDGQRNMPDGEVFTEPVKESVHGFISFSFPAIYNGREVKGIRLQFKEGKVIKAQAKKNEAFLKQILKTDKGSSYVGEFGMGLNFNIKKYVKQILFDEKIGGTIHLALGRAYKETGGENESAIHWDMIKDLRNKGEVWIDKKKILEKGRILV